MSAAVAPAPTSERKLVRLNKAVERLGISRATLYREMERDPQFPKPVRVRGRAGPRRHPQPPIRRQPQPPVPRRRHQARQPGVGAED